MKAIKWVLLSVIAVLLALTAYLVLVFDLNDFKPQIVNVVKKQTGRDLVIAQDLSWTFFPSLGIKLGDVSFANPEGFSPVHMLEVNQAVADVALMPLFSKQIEIDQLNLDGLTVNLVTLANGKTSFDGLSGQESTKNKEVNQPQDGKGGQSLEGVSIGGINITNTKITVVDRVANQEQVFNLESLTLGAFTLGQFADLAYSFNGTLPDMQLSSEGTGKVKISPTMDRVELASLNITNLAKGKSLPKGSITSTLLANININLKNQSLALMLEKLTAESVQAKGKVDVMYGAKVPQVNAQLDFNDIDLDKLLPQDDSKEVKPSQEGKAAPSVEPDLTGLKAVDMKLAMTAKSIKVANLVTQNWQLDAQLKQGVMTLKSLSADLYGGKLTASALLDSSQKVASYRFNKSLKGVKVRDLLKDAADVDFLSGGANFSLAGSGRSLLVDKIKQNLKAKGDFSVTDGSLYGVNIPQMIRSAQAKLKGDFSESDTGEEKTDFSSLTGSFHVSNGVANNPDLNMSSPLIRLAGAGSANIIKETLDYKLKTSLVGSLKGQGGDDLSGVDIPLKISGTFAEPKYALDTSGLLDSKIEQEKEKVKDKLKDKLLEKFGGF